MTTFVNLATKSPLVCDVNGSNRHVFGIRPPLQGQFLAASISVNSVDNKEELSKYIRNKHLKDMHVMITVLQDMKANTMYISNEINNHNQALPIRWGWSYKSDNVIVPYHKS